MTSPKCPSCGQPLVIEWITNPVGPDGCHVFCAYRDCDSDVAYDGATERTVEAAVKRLKEKIEEEKEDEK